MFGGSLPSTSLPLLTSTLPAGSETGRLPALRTTVNGPQRIRQRGWEGWWGWEAGLGGVQADFYDLSAATQEEAVEAWFAARLEWLTAGGLLRAKG